MWYKIERTIVSPREIFKIKSTLTPFPSGRGVNIRPKNRLRFVTRISIPQITVEIEIWSYNSTDFLRVVKGSKCINHEYALQIYLDFLLEDRKKIDKYLLII